jgi:hypothetical protein
MVSTMRWKFSTFPARLAVKAVLSGSNGLSGQLETDEIELSLSALDARQDTKFGMAS